MRLGSSFGRFADPSINATFVRWNLPDRISLDYSGQEGAELSLVPEGATTGRYIAEKRYRADVVVQGSATPAEIISQIELASDSDYLKVDGSWALDIPTSEADSGIELVDEMLASRATLIAGENLSSRFTSIAAAYIAPNENWKRVFTPEYESSTLLSKEGRALPRQDIALDAVTSPTQAYRLLLRQAYREEMQEQISIEGFHDLLRIRRGVNFKYKSDNLGISSFKRFVAENVSTESGSSPVVIVAREEDRARVYADPQLADYPVYTDDTLVLPDTPPFPVQALVARAVPSGIELAITMPDIPGRIEIYDSPTSGWAEASLKLVTTDSLVHIDYDAGTTRWFWARNNIGGEVSTRFPNDNVSTITATVPAAADVRTARIIKAVIGNAPPNDEWVAGVLWIDPGNGRQWRGEPDPWVAFPQPGTYVASTKTVTWDDSKQNLVLGSDLSWTTAGGGTPSYGLLNTLLAVRGMANVVGLNTGVQFALESGITSFTATDFYGFVIDQRVPDTVFVDGTENAVLNSIDINLATSVVSAVFRDDITGNPQTGPNFRKPGSSYTFVVRLGTTVYALPVRSGDDEDPYALVPPTGFLAAVRARRTAVIAGNTVPNASVALVDETPWTHGTDWAQAFNTVTRQERREYVTVFTGTDDVSPFTWPSVGIIPDFIDGSMQVLQLDKTRRNWTANQLSRWVTIPEQAIEEIFTATEDRPLTDDQQPLDEWIYLQIEDAPETLGVPEAIWASDLAAAGYSARKEYGWRATRLVPVGSEPWRVSFWGHWGAGAPVQAISRRQYGERALTTVDGGWTFRDDDTPKTNLLGNWEKIKAAAFLDLSFTDTTGWPVLELARVRIGDVIVVEPVDNQFASYEVVSKTSISGGTRFGIEATERYSDGDGSDIDGTLRVYFPRLPAQKPEQVSKFPYNGYSGTTALAGQFRFEAGSTPIGFDTASTFRQAVVSATKLIVSDKDAGQDELQLSSMALDREPAVTFTRNRQTSWASWAVDSIEGPEPGVGWTINLGELLAFENEEADYSASTDDVVLGFSETVRVSPTQMSVRILDAPIGEMQVGAQSRVVNFRCDGEIFDGPPQDLTITAGLFVDGEAGAPGFRVAIPADLTAGKEGARQGSITIFFPSSIPKKYGVDLTLQARYGRGSASDIASWTMLPRPGLELQFAVNGVFAENRGDSGYSETMVENTPVILDVGVHVFGGDPRATATYNWDKWSFIDENWEGLFPGVENQREFGIVWEYTNVVRDDVYPTGTRIAYHGRYAVSVVKGTAVGQAQLDITALVPEGVETESYQRGSSTSRQLGPSGRQETSVLATAPLNMVVGQRLPFDAGEVVDASYETAGPQIVRRTVNNAAIIEALSSGNAVFIVKSGNTRVMEVPVAVAAAVDSDVFDVELDAPRAVPAGTDPVQLEARSVNAVGPEGAVDIVVDVSGSADLSDFSDGSLAKKQLQDNPRPYLSVPSTVDADEDSTVKVTGVSLGTQAVKERTVKITVLGYPNPPTNLVFSSVSATGFTVSWTAAASETGKAVPTGYRVVARDKDTGAAVATHTTTGTTQAVSGLQSGTTYRVTVATDSASDYSRTSLEGEQTTNSATGTGTLPVPFAPTSLVFSNVSATGMTVAWTASAGTGRASVTGYQVLVRTGSEVGEIVQTHAVTGTSLALTGLSSTTAYNVQVRANSVAGYSAALRGSQTTSSPLAVPLAPTALTFSNVAQNSMTIGWTAPVAASTRAAVVSYRFRLRTGPPSSTLVQETILSSTTLSIAVTGLAYFTTYLVDVEAGSDSGYSPALVGSRNTLSALVPNPPTSLTFSSIAQTTLTVGWTAPATSADRAPVTGYRLLFRTGSASGNIARTLTAGASATSLAATGLTANTTYYVSIEARNSTGFSSALAGNTKTLAPVPTVVPVITNAPASLDEGQRFVFQSRSDGTATGTSVYEWSESSAGDPRPRGAGTSGNRTRSTWSFVAPEVSADKNITIGLKETKGEIVGNTSAVVLIKNIPNMVVFPIAAWTYQASYTDRFGQASSRIHVSFPLANAPEAPRGWFSRRVTINDAERKLAYLELSVVLTGRSIGRFTFFARSHGTRSATISVSPSSKYIRFRIQYTDAGGTVRRAIVDPFIPHWSVRGSGLRERLSTSLAAGARGVLDNRARVPMQFQMLWGTTSELNAL